MQRQLLVWLLLQMQQAQQLQQQISYMNQMGQLAPPEMIQQSGHNFGVDWWALGILIYEMRIGVTPFFNKNKNLLLTKIQRAKVVFPDKVKYNLDYSDDFVDIVEKLLSKKSNTRLGSQNDAHEILSHPWFADLNISDLEAQKIEPPLKPE